MGSRWGRRGWVGAWGSCGCSGTTFLEDAPSTTEDWQTRCNVARHPQGAGWC